MLLLGPRPEGGASVDRQVRPDGVADREPGLRSDGVGASEPQLGPDRAGRRPGTGLDGAGAAPPSALRPGPPGSRPSPPAATGWSSPPPPSFTTSSSDCRPSCAPRCPTATSARSSSKPSPKSSRGSKPPLRRTKAPRKTLSQSQTSPTTCWISAAVKRAVYERDAGRCRYEDERGETVHGATRARTPPPAPLRPRRGALGRATSPWRANATTLIWRRSTTAGKPSLGIAARGAAR